MQEHGSQGRGVSSAEMLSVRLWIVATCRRVQRKAELLAKSLGGNT